MEIAKENEGEEFITCEKCTKQCYDIENMEKDNNSNWICLDCRQQVYNFFFPEENEENTEL